MKKWILLILILLAAIMAVIVSAKNIRIVPDVSCKGGFTSEINGENVSVFCSTPVPSSIETAVSATTNTPTATNTVVFIPNIVDRPVTVAVIGDSNSEPYEFINRGGPDGYAWTEVLRDWRGVDFGINDEFIVAHSGDNTTHLAHQIDELSAYIQNNEIGTVIIWMGLNDLEFVCNDVQDEATLQSLQESMFNNLENSVIELLELGMAANHIYMVNQSDRTGDPGCKNLEQVNSVVANINADLSVMADNRGIHLIDANIILNVLANYILNEKGDIIVDGVTIYNAQCDEQTCLFTSDGHANTVLSGLLANTFFANAIEFSPLSDNELVRAAGLK